jgi:hypothetical protein
MNVPASWKKARSQEAAGKKTLSLLTMIFVLLAYACCEQRQQQQQHVRRCVNNTQLAPVVKFVSSHTAQAMLCCCTGVDAPQQNIVAVCLSK